MDFLFRMIFCITLVFNSAFKMPKNTVDEQVEWELKGIHQLLVYTNDISSKKKKVEVSL
jgi:hypothetical protein